MKFFTEREEKITMLRFSILGLLCLFFYTQCYKYNEAKYYIEDKDSNFITIREGIYTIGSPKNEYGYDSKGHQERIRNIKIDNFYLARYEVTQMQYEEIMGEHNSSFYGDNFPVDNVTWYEAVDFCNRLSEKEGLQPVYIINKDIKDPNNKNISDKYRYLVEWNNDANGYRLPTSDEWEIACRAGSRTIYNTGNAINQNQANFGGSDKDINTHILPVGSYKPNAWGLYDMHGNVNEWCWDMLNNMVRVIRGGAWNDEVYYLRSGKVEGDIPSGNGGIRLARNAN